MKKFSLSDYLNNPNINIQTKSGLSVRIICTTYTENYPILALINMSRDPDIISESIHTYSSDGEFLLGSKNNEMNLIIV